MVKENVLDMASYESRKGRDISLDLIQEGPNRLKRYFNMLKDKNQKSLDDFIMLGNSKKVKQI